MVRIREILVDPDKLPKACPACLPKLNSGEFLSKICGQEGPGPSPGQCVHQIKGCERSTAPSLHIFAHNQRMVRASRMPTISTRKGKRRDLA